MSYLQRKRFAKSIVILTATIFLVLSFNHFKVFPNLRLHSRSGFLTFFSKYQFETALEAHAKTVSWNNSEQIKFIILAMTDNSFTDMAMNLYLSSFKRFNISNFLFVGGGKNACEKLHRQNVQCFDFWDDPDSNQSNNYGSKEFIRKMNIRTEMILQALRLNYSVLHTDLDVVFLKDPMPEIESLLERNDMAILWDHLSYNAGFLAIKSTPNSTKVYNHLQHLTNESDKLDDQKALNIAINNVGKDGIKIHSLDRKRYLCGKDYYEIGNNNFPSRNFTDNCPKCVVIHNNWIVSKEAKIYRFKETNMWFLDDDRYYSDENRKYLLYYNPVINKPPKGFNVREAETSALRSGFKIAEMLNRTLIIPRFHCNKNKECPLNNWFKVKKFHDTFAPNYRESSFLLSDFVPRSISMKPSKTCLSGAAEQSLISKSYSPTCNKQDSNPKLKCIPFNPIPTLLITKRNEYFWNETLDNFPSSQVMDLRTVDSLDESIIAPTLAHCPDQVLVLSSLLYVEVKFIETTKEKLFNDKLNSGLVAGGYTQM